MSYFALGPALKGQSSEIIIPFLTYLDGPGLEYESLMVLTFFKRPLQCWIIVRNFNVVKDNSFWKNYIFGIFFLNRIKPFRGFFLKLTNFLGKVVLNQRNFSERKKVKMLNLSATFQKGNNIFPK
jgi:hypothetical protein